MMKKGYSTCLFQFEDVFVKIELKLLISKVDAKLFKTVMLVILKSKNIQNSYRATLKSQSSGQFYLIYTCYYRYLCWGSNLQCT